MSNHTNEAVQANAQCPVVRTWWPLQQLNARAWSPLRGRPQHATLLLLLLLQQKPLLVLGVLLPHEGSLLLLLT